MSFIFFQTKYLFWCCFSASLSSFEEKSWRSIGLGRPSSWRATWLVALITGIVLQLKDFVSEPIAHWIWRQPETAPSLITHLERNLTSALLSLALVWTFAAFGEELGYRAFLLGRTMEALNGSRVAVVVALFVSSVLFGFGHFFKGPTGVFDSTCSGLILGTAFLLTGGNLWVVILAHGISDTIAVLVSYFGWVS